MKTHQIVSAALVVATWLGCGPFPGELGGKCKPRGECDEGLSCIDDRCVDLVAADVTAAPKGDVGDEEVGGEGSAPARADPPATAAPVSPPDDGTFELVVKADAIDLEGRSVTTAELGAAIAGAAEAKPDTRVAIHVDEAVPYLRVTSVFDLVKRNGLKNVSFAPAAGAPEPAPPPGQLEVEVLETGLLLDGRKIESAALGAAVAKAAAKDPSTPVRLRAAAGVPYDRLVDTIDLVASSGLGKMTFVVAAPPAKK